VQYTGIQLQLLLLLPKIGNFVAFDFRTVGIERSIVFGKALVAPFRRQMLLLLTPHVEIYFLHVIARRLRLRIASDRRIVLRNRRYCDAG
jgi:hypothetical protein